MQHGAVYGELGELPTLSPQPLCCVHFGPHIPLLSAACPRNRLLTLPLPVFTFQVEHSREVQRLVDERRQLYADQKVRIMHAGSATIVN